MLIDVSLTAELYILVRHKMVILVRYKMVKSRSAAKSDMIDQYIQSQELKAAAFRLYREGRSENILIQAKIQQQEALMKFRKYNNMTLGELKNIRFEDITTTKRIRKNRSKSAEVIQDVVSAKRPRLSRSSSRLQKGGTPAKPPRRARIGELILSVQGSPLLVNRVISNTPLSVKEKKVMGQIRILRNNLNQMLNELD